MTMNYPFTKTNHYRLMDIFMDAKKDFIVLGLCGKTGSGSSTVADILQKPFEQLNLPVPADNASDSIADHEYRLLYRYARVHWRAFYRIKTSALITAHVLDESEESFRNFLDGFLQTPLELRNEEIVKNIIKDFFSSKMRFDLNQWVQVAPKEHETALRWMKSDQYPTDNEGETEQKQVKFTPKSGHENDKTSSSYSKEKCYLNFADKSLSPIPFDYHADKEAVSCFFKVKDLYALYREYQKRRQRKKGFDNPLLIFLLQQFIYDYLPEACKRLWTKLAQYIPDVQVAALQQLGNHLRISGKPYCAEFKPSAFTSIVVDINTAIKLLNASLAWQKWFIEDNKLEMPMKQSLVVVDSIKNPFESMYLKDRYASYYLLGIYTEDKTRWERLRRDKKLHDERIRAIDIIEQTKEFKRQYKSILKSVSDFTDKAPLSFIQRYVKEAIELCNESNISDIKKLIDCEEKLDKYRGLILPQDCFCILENVRTFIKKNLPKAWDDIKEKEHEDLKKKTACAAEDFPDLWRISPVVMDTIRTIKEHQLLDELPFVLQNVGDSLEAADIFINNKTDSRQYLRLKKKLVRYVSLIMNPGLVLPTPVERCMQLAYTAKLNSGCISRQVGAVITDSEYHLLSIGWNQQPEGQVPCTYRDLCSLYYHWSPEAYSEYECDDRDQVQKQIKEPVTKLLDTPDSPLNIQGKLPAYCFKDIYNSIMRNDNQVHPRSLHGEETAFLNLGQYSARGGILFTTSSPCELCAKKAKYEGISKIYYIEPYSGISLKHVLNIGPKVSRPEMLLFTGAIGRAYTQLYTPLMPKKDELAFWLGSKVDVDLFRHIKEKAEEIGEAINAKEGSDETT